MSVSENQRTGLEIAVIGMACRFPGANNIAEFWNNLENGVESITFFSEEELADAGISQSELQKPNYIKARGIVDNVEYFDARFFDYTPAETEIMDPQARLFHEVVWEALEDSGYVPDSYGGFIGLYAGASANFYWEALTLISGMGGDIDTFSAQQLKHKDFLATRISYKFNLKGPSVVSQTACSTSLLAAHQACRALLMGECDIALAGGVTVTLPPKQGYYYVEGMINSPDGHCRSFDASAGGVVAGDGAGVVVLKSFEDALEDGDHIYAVIKSSAANNDGLRKVGYTAPSVEGQSEVIRLALSFGQVESESIGFVECHGTGTNLGDPVEVEALRLAFETEKRNYCAIGSVKSNMGHLDSAAGAAGLIKTVLALKHRVIPPSLHYEAPNRAIDFDNTPFYVNTAARDWKSDGYPLRAGVSSFGIGGTNVHVVLEEAPVIEPDDSTVHNRPYRVIVLSAKTAGSLDRAAANLSGYFEKNPGVNFQDAVYTLQVGRKCFDNRGMAVCTSQSEAAEILSDPGKIQSHLSSKEESKLVFMFSGQGSQYVDMGRELYRTEEVFRKELDHCLDLLFDIMGEDVKPVLYPVDSPAPPVQTGNKTASSSRADIFAQKINQFIYTSPIKFAFEYSLARLMMSWGLTPYAMIGHSFGEYVAACIAEVFSLKDGLTLAALRGRLMHEAPEGIMMSVPVPEDELLPLLEANGEVDIAAVNGPEQCIVSGAPQPVDALEEQLNQKGVECVKLRVPRASHSRMMEPVLNKFKDGIARIAFNKPQIPYISGLTGTWITAEQASDPGYWAGHLRHTIRFADGLRELLKEKNAVFVQVGSDRSLSGFVDFHPAKTPGHQVLNLVRHPKEQVSDAYFLMNKLGLLWLYGVEPGWNAFYRGNRERRQRVPLPTYSFDRQPYPVGIGSLATAAGKLLGTPSLDKKADLGDWFYTPSWIRNDLPADTSGQAVEPATWLVFMDNEDIGTALVSQYLEPAGHDFVTVTPGDEFSAQPGNRYTLNPANPKDYNALLEHLKSAGKMPGRILHLWNVSPYESIDKSLDTGFYCLFHLVKGLGELSFSDHLHIDVITGGMQEITGDDLTSPGHAAVLGPVKVIPLEFPNITCRSIDIILPVPGSRQEEILISQIGREIGTVPSQLPVIGFRGRYRWEQTFKPLRLEKPAEVSRLKEKGVYLITGGLGGIGLVLAEFLAASVRPRLILTGRSEFPVPGEWDNWLDRHPGDDKTSQIILKLRQLEDAGADVLTFRADVTSREQMDAVVGQAMERFGTVDGVIHAAGVPDGAAILRRTREMTAGILGPKVHGMLVLDSVLKDRGAEPGFLIACSSVNAFIPSFGQLGHCAANAFMDAFSLYNASRGNTAVITVNWNAWIEVGQAVESIKELEGTQDISMIDGLLSKEGVDAFSRIISDNQPQVVVSVNDFAVKTEQFNTRQSEETREDEAETEAPARTLLKRPQLSTEYIPPQTGTEEKLGQIWQAFFGYDQVGIEDDFFEVGGDSLKAMMIIARIGKEMDVKVPVTDFFTCPTIRLLAEYIDGTGNEARTAAGIAKAEERAYYPLSSAQKRMYILNQMQPDGIGYNLPQVIHLSGTVEPQRLAEAFHKLIDRHHGLRTTFRLADGEPVQEIHPQNPFEIDYLELDDTANGISDLVESLVQPFDLSRLPLMRVWVVDTGERNVLIFDKHHIITDGISNNILLRDFTALYNGEILPDLNLQYQDYVLWKEETLKRDKEGLISQEQFWLKTFDGDIPVLELPTDFERPAVQTFEGSSINFGFSPAEAAAMSALARQEDVTLFVLILAIFDVFLSKLGGSEDIIVGTPVAGRWHPDLQQIVGMFVNTLAFRGFPRKEKPFNQFLEEVKQGTWEAFENQDYQFEELVENVSINRDMGRNPLFDVMFKFQNQADRSIDGTVTDPSEQSSIYEYEHPISKFDLTLTGEEIDDRLMFNLEYSVSLFKPGTVQRFAGYFKEIVSSVLESAVQRIGDIQILTGDEKKQVLYDFNDTALSFPPHRSLIEVFEQQVEKAPDSPAVSYNGRRLTYRELSGTAHVIAGQLRQKGVDINSIVAIIAENSLEMIVGIISVLTAGGAYLPIDPQTPAARKEFMLTDSKARALLVQERWIRNHPEENTFLEGKNFLQVDENMAVEELAPESKPVLNIRPQDLAYVIYTSGTTGKPKGVLLKQQNLLNYVFWFTHMTGMTNEDKGILTSSYSFDLGYTSLVPPLLNGGEVHVVDREMVLMPASLLDYISREKITYLKVTPSLFSTLVSNPGLSREKCPNLRLVVMGGEAINVDDVEEAHRRCPHTGIINHYGPTEATIGCVAQYIDFDRFEDYKTLPTIGRPIGNAGAYILGRNLELLPAGVPGELSISGACLARGYLNRPELTADRFVENPYRENEPMYRTGDRARWLPDGRIEFLGRMDDQVKIRGYRIEPGEIERRLLGVNIPGLKDAAVMVRENRGGEKVLCAYIAAEDTLDFAGIKAALAADLPQYMVPSFFIRLDEMPLTANKKLDRRALPAPEAKADKNYNPPSNDREWKLAELWADILYLDKESIGINDNFFELGGHSLKATALAAKIHKAFNWKVPLVDIFQKPTIKALVELLDEQIPGDTFVSIEAAELKEYYPLSSAQKRLYILQQIDKNSTGYNMPKVLVLEGNPDKHHLENAFLCMIHRHEAFRTAFGLLNGEPVQRIVEPGAVTFRLDSYRDETANIPGMIETFIRPFDLEQAPLLRAAISDIKDRPGSYVLMVDMHHIISDGTSLGIFIEELTALYGGGELAPPVLQYKDYSQWQNSGKVNDSLAAQEAFWVNEFSGDIPVLMLPTDYSRRAIQGFEGASTGFELSRRESDALNAYASKEDVTLYMVLLSIFTVFLSKLSNQDRIVIGSPVAGRNHADLENIIGVFVNTLALKNSPSAGKPFGQLVKEVKENALQAFSNQDYQYEELVERLSVPRDAGRNPLFDVMFVLQNLDAAEVEIPGIKLTSYEYETHVAKFDLMLMAMEAEHGISFVLEYSTELFREDTIHRFIAIFKKVVAAVLEDGNTRISEIEIIPGTEKERILNEFNDTRADYPRDKAIHHLFEEQAAKSPGSIALAISSTGDERDYRSMTYRETDRESNRWAHRLQAQGITPGAITAVKLERSPGMVACILGILKCGGAYLPIAADCPPDRLDYILNDSGAALLITDQNHRDVPGDVTLLSTRNRYDEAGEADAPAAANHVRPGDISYVIYTSGSTGNPKGVVVEHRSVVNLLCQLQKRYPLGPSGVYLFKTAYIFDVSVTELFGWFMDGGRLAILEQGGEKDPAAIMDAVNRHKVTHINFVPSMFRVFVEQLETGDTAKLDSLEYVFLAGEALIPSAVDAFVQRCGTGVRLENLYGPTEATVYASGYSLARWSGSGSIPIGEPLPNTCLYIIDKSGNLQPVGVPGELCIAGSGLARGYLNRPELTAGKFVLSPYRSQRCNTLYKTGDLSRWLPDGNIEFLGRLDHQVKVRGFRIELGEIENHLSRHGSVKDTAVICRPDALGNNAIFAYVVLSGSENPVPEEAFSAIKESLARSLPAYMIPAEFIALDELPLNPSGKLDRKQLPDPGAESRTGYAAPRNMTEETLVSLFASVLGKTGDTPGIDDNFFDLGGHSLAAILLISKIHKTFHAKLTLGEMFLAPTVRTLAERVKDSGKERYHSIPPAEKKEYYPLSSAQKRLYVLAQMDEESVAYNMPSVLVLEENVDETALTDVFQRLITRHESLRTSFRMAGEEPVQVVHDDVEFDAPNYSYDSNMDDASLLTRFVRPFRLSRAPLLRAAITSVPGQKKHLLTVDMHHIISDGISVNLLAKEFHAVFAGEELPVHPVQYKDFAVWQHSPGVKESLAAGESYWLERFDADIPVLNLPADYARPAVKSFEGSSLEFAVDEPQTRALSLLASSQEATLYMTLLSVFYIFLSKLSGSEDIVVGTPVAGRRHEDLHHIIGMFVNTLPLRNVPSPGKTFEAFLLEVKQHTLHAFENQDYPFEELVEKLDLTRDTSRNPLFDVMFLFQDREMVSWSDNETADPGSPGMEKQDGGVSKFDMTLAAAEVDNRLAFGLQYYSKLFKKETIERFAGYFKTLLSGVLSNPGQHISELEIISPEEKRQLLYDYNNTRSDYPHEKTIHRLFEEQVEKTPDNTAVLASNGSDSLSYRELENRAENWARLLYSKGTGRSEVVGVMMEHSIDIVVVMLGILKAGGAYLPLEPTTPPQRIEYMLQNADVRILIQSPAAEEENRPFAFNGEILKPGSETTGTGQQGKPIHTSEPGDLAYIIYTSGSTGRPKGVMVEHRGLVNYITWAAGVYLGPGHELPGDFPLYSSIAFDLTVTSVYVPLVTGNKVVVYPRIDGEFVIPKIIEDNHVQVVKLTPTHLRMLKTQAVTGSGIHGMIVGGEELTVSLARDIHEMFDGKINIYNEYGPTEAVVGCMIYKYDPMVDNRQSVPIGKPAANTRIYILDKNRKPAAPGVAGEMYIAGDGVTRGYMNNAAMTNEAYVPDPFAGGATMYRTGDLAQWLPDGNMEYLGRIDHQVKIRGFRIEPGEIEDHVMRHPEVKEVVVIARDGLQGAVENENPEDKTLCAYVVPREPDQFEVSGLRDHLTGKLPDYMIPSFFIKLNDFPLTASGKIDRKALPAPELVLDNRYEAPATEIEQRLAETWRQVLGAGTIGVNDNFFELGGDSIKAIQISARLRKYGLTLKTSDLFHQPYIRKLADYVKKTERLIDQGSVAGKIRLSPIQRWFFEHPSSHLHHYNHSVILYKPEGFNEEHIARTMTAVIEHHDALRIVFDMGGDDVVQRNRSIGGELFDLEIFDYKHRDEETWRIEIKKEIARVQESIDLTRGPLVKLALFKTSGGDHLLIVIHHLVVDGVSWRILFEDISRGYVRMENGQEIAFQDKTDSFKYWMEQSGEYARGPGLLKELDYWRNLESVELERLPVARKISEEEKQNRHKRTFTLSFSEEQSSALLRKVNRAYNTEINDILLSALGMSIKEWAGIGKIAVHMEGHGREDIIDDIDISRTVGWFTTLFPILLDMESDKMSYTVKSVKETIRCIPHKGIGYGMLKYLAPRAEIGDMRFELEPEISFNYLGEFGQESGEEGIIRLSEINKGESVSPHMTNRYVLDVNGMIADGKLILSITYNHLELEESKIEALADSYQYMLEAIIRHCVEKEEPETTPSDLGCHRYISLKDFSRMAVELKQSLGEECRMKALYPLSPMQGGMLYHAVKDKKAAAYFEQSVFTLRGHIDKDLLEKSFNILIERYDIFRTIFAYEKLDRFLQAVLKERTAKVDYINIADLEEDEQLLRVEEYKKQDIKRGFDLSRDILIRMALVERGNGIFHLVLSFHHIIMDGWCIPIVFKDLSRIYQSLKAGETITFKPAVPYSDYIEWLEASDIREGLRYWRTYLAGYDRQVSLLKHAGSSSNEEYRLEQYHLMMDETLTAGLNRVGRENQVTLNIIFRVLWAILLQKYNNCEDVVFGAVVSGRPAEIEGIEEMVGLMINTIPVRIRTGKNKLFSGILKEVQHEAIQGRPFEYVSLAEIQSNSSLKMDLIDNILSFQNFPVQEEVKNIGNDNQNHLGFEVEGVDIFDQANYEFYITISSGKQTSVKFSFNASTYPGENVRQIAAHFLALAQQVAQDSQIDIRQLDLLTKAEKEQLLKKLKDEKAQMNAHEPGQQQREYIEEDGDFDF